MANYSVSRPEPVTPPATITLELSVEEAQYVYAALVMVNPVPEDRFSGDPVYEALGEALADVRAHDFRYRDFAEVNGN